MEEGNIKRLFVTKDGSYMVGKSNFSDSECGSPVSCKSKELNFPRRIDNLKKIRKFEFSAKKCSVSSTKNEILAKTMVINLENRRANSPNSVIRPKMERPNSIAIDKNMRRSNSYSEIKDTRRVINFGCRNRGKENSILPSGFDLDQAIGGKVDCVSSKSRSSYHSGRKNSAYFRANCYGMSLKQYTANFISRNSNSSLDCRSDRGMARRSRKHTVVKDKGKMRSRDILAGLKKVKRKLRLEIGLFNRAFDELERGILCILKARRKEAIKIFHGYEKLLLETEKNFKKFSEKSRNCTKENNFFSRDSQIVDVEKFKLVEKTKEGVKTIKEYKNNSILTSLSMNKEIDNLISGFLCKDLKRKIAEAPKIQKLGLSKEDFNSILKSLEKKFGILNEFKYSKKVFDSLKVDVVFAHSQYIGPNNKSKSPDLAKNKTKNSTLLSRNQPPNPLRLLKVQKMVIHFLP